MVQLFLRNFQTQEAEWYVYPVLIFATSLGEVTATSQSAHWMQRQPGQRQLRGPSRTVFTKCPRNESEQARA